MKSAENRSPDQQHRGGVSTATIQETIVMGSREISAREVLKDIRFGMTAAEIMVKYRVSGKGFQDLLAQLVNLGAVERDEIEKRSTLYYGSGGDPHFRRTPRKRVGFPLQVADLKNSLSMGYVKDISPKGVSVAGLEAKPGEIKSLVVRVGGFSGCEPFGFEARCVWVQPSNGRSEMIAGFEIIRISETCMKELTKLLGW